jgi:signal transduction histidine kinase
MADLVAYGGWLGAILAGVAALVVMRSLAIRMEAVARAAHEVSGPLTAARLGLRLSEVGGQLSAARFRAIDLELSRASLALQDLATVGRPGDRTVAFGEVDVAALLADSVEAWRATALSRGVDLRFVSCSGRLLVLGDRIRLAQATGNLIANGIEHGGRGVEVRARADLAGVRIEVTDDGPGLPAPVAELRRRPRRGHRARGRGLAIAAAVAESHGGRLASAPTPRGARLVLELPAPVAEHSAAPGPSGPPPEA